MGGGQHYVAQEDVHRLTYRPKERLASFLALNVRKRHAAWLHLSRVVQRDLVTHMANTDLVPLLEAVDPGQATDMLRQLSAHRRGVVLANVQQHLRETLQTLLSFDPETAAGFMSLDYIQVEDTHTFTEVIARFRAHERRTGRPPAILVLRAGVLVGQLHGWQLCVYRSAECIAPYMRLVATVSHAMRQRDVVQTFRTHPHDKVAVVNDDGDALGVIYSDDILRMLEEEASRSLVAFAGVQREESVHDSAFRKVHRRYSWLVVNLATGFLAAFTVGLFDSTIAQFVLLAVYMPIVAGMGGNAATQTLAVVVRGIALRQITLAGVWRTLVREVIAGFLNGVINGVIVAGVVFAVHHDIRLALVLAIAMVANLVVAGFFGTVVPLIMERLGKDPATSATIFITTATDVLGFLVFLGLGSILLR